MNKSKFESEDLTEPYRYLINFLKVVFFGLSIIIGYPHSAYSSTNENKVLQDSEEVSHTEEPNNTSPPLLSNKNKTIEDLSSEDRIIETIKFQTIPYFEINKDGSQSINNILSWLNSTLPKTRQGILYNYLSFKEGDTLLMSQLEQSKEDLENAHFINKAEIITIPKEGTNRVDIIIRTKDVFPIMINPLAFSATYSNILGSGHSIYGILYPQGSLLSNYVGKYRGYGIEYDIDNINNSHFDFQFKRTDLPKTKLTKLRLRRPFKREVTIGGATGIKGGYNNRNLDIYDELKHEALHSYNSFDLWSGGSIPIGDDDIFYKRIIITGGGERWQYYNVSDDLKLQSFYDYRTNWTYGGGIAFLRKRNFKIKELYGKKNKEEYSSGEKLYFKCGNIRSMKSNRQYFGLDGAKGIVLEKVGYLFANTRIVYKTPVTVILENNKEQPLTSSTSIYLKTGIAFNKIDLNNWGLREIFYCDYTTRVGSKSIDIVSLGGISYLGYYDGYYSKLRHRIRGCLESIIYTPLDFYSISIDPLFFVEGLLTKHYNRQNPIRKDICLGGGLLMKVVIFEVRGYVGYSPTVSNIGEGNPGSITIGLAISPYNIGANMNIDGPYNIMIN